MKEVKSMMEGEENPFSNTINRFRCQRARSLVQSVSNGKNDKKVDKPMQKISFVFKVTSNHESLYEKKCYKYYYKQIK